MPHAGPHPPQAPGYAQQTPYAAQPAPGGWAWRPPSSPPAPQPNSFQYPFGYPPGTRVQVTWSNGQRYPATVTQVSGSQHFVVFPDGQRHWVDAQYLSRS
ncbi:MAG TPA: hypothetical protein VM580_01525 [Labilithrix sp.]|nr:hypothetical protein [Labilithrix sp.]